MRKLAIAIIAILFVGLAGCAAAPSNPSKKDVTAASKEQHAWPDLWPDD